MPVVKVDTNVAQSAIPADFVKKLSGIATKSTGKPESYVAVFVNAGQLASFGGTDSPCAFVEFQSIGGFGSKKNQIAQSITEIIANELHVPQERMYVKFVDPDPSTFAFKGNTFA